MDVLNPGGSDHSPLVVPIDINSMPAMRQFKFLYCLTEHDHFLNVVAHAWTTPTTGVRMFSI